MSAPTYLSVEELKEFLDRIPNGYLEPTDKFFDDGNTLNPEFKKEGVITVADEEELHIQNSVSCNVFGCKETFDTVFAYQSHYNTQHRYICSQCKKNLPTPHLLDLHLSEQHDSFFAVQSQKKPMYICYLEECTHKSATPEERKDHCIRLHKFPSNYRFDNIGSHKSADKSSNSMDTTESELGQNNNKPVPFAKKNANFAFGHNRVKVFSDKSYAKALSKHSAKKADQMDVCNALEDKKTITDLMESLPS